MRGKPKGIRRKHAAGKQTLREKLLVSQYGDLADWPETFLVDNAKFILQEECARKKVTKNTSGTFRPFYSDQELARDKKELESDLARLFGNAILKNDVEFFERLAAIARWNRDGRMVVDELAFGILMARWLLKKEGKPCGSKSIATKLTNSVFYKGRPFDDATIRRTLRQLDIKD